MTDTGDALAPGTRLDELEVERVLGAGGFGVTYLARDVSLDAWRAVKEYLPRDWGTRLGDGTIGPRTGADAEDYQWGLTRFLDEARVLAKFDHPHLVRVYRVFEAQGTAYMVTEYVEGQTLSAALQASGPWPEGQVRELLEALTDGLSAVHGAGLLHRDIKPGNVMVRPDGTPVLIDFGAARQAMGRQSRSVTAVLTPGYAPIEQYSPRGNQGPWTDIYALGALAYEALSGQVPDDATERVAEDPLRPLAEVAPLPVSAAMGTAVDAALALHKQDRPQSLVAWRALLAVPSGVAPVSSRPHVAESFGASSPSGVGAGSGAVAAERPRGSVAAWRRWWLPGTAAAGLVAVLLAVALTAPWNGDGSDPPPEVLPAAVEEALGLNLAARQEIQAGLEAAGFDVGVADGRFGDGTRVALREWQAAVGVPATGYLDAETAAELQAAAEQAAAEQVAAEQVAAEQAAAEQAAAEQAAAEQVAAEQVAAEQAAAEQAAAEQAAAEQAAAEQVAAEQVAAEQAAAEQAAAEQAAAEQVAAEQVAAEQAAAEQAAADAAKVEAERRAEIKPLLPEMVVIPAGRFRMGCNHVALMRVGGATIEIDDCDSSEEALPVHAVTVGSFALSKYEVTFEEYDRFTEATGREQVDDEGWGRGGRPVVNVSWEDAQAYVSWLSAETGDVYRLPTEAEWEYAARAGTTTQYNWGDGRRDNWGGPGSRQPGQLRWLRQSVGR